MHSVFLRLSFMLISLSYNDSLVSLSIIEITAVYGFKRTIIHFIIYHYTNWGTVVVMLL